MCRERGFAVDVEESAPGRPNLALSSRAGTAPGLLLFGHTDVVPVGDGWTVDPFGGECATDGLFGRGAPT